MYAGHIVLGIFAVLTELFFMAPFHGSGALNMVAAPIWLVLLIAMYALEFVVALIQAYVFTLLTAVYIESATSKH
jgi:F-type H+-transporting ATPase subunit a